MAPIRSRGAEVAARLRADGHPLHHLGLTMHGHPRHPLYIPYANLPEALVQMSLRLRGTTSDPHRGQAAPPQRAASFPFPSTRQIPYRPPSSRAWLARSSTGPDWTTSRTAP